MSDQPRFKPNGDYVYETPDSGVSIYAREVGTQERFLIGRRLIEDAEYITADIARDINRMCGLHSNLRDEVEKLLTLYHLLKDNNQGDVQWHPV